MFDFLPNYYTTYLEATVTTLKVSLIALLVGLILGIVICLAKISTFTAENDPEATGMAIAFKKGKDNSNKELLEQVNAVIKEIQAQKTFEKELDKYAKVAAQSE